MAVTFVSDANKGELLKEEWITIADITTTEEVQSISKDKDINGNSFTCKEMDITIAYPSTLTENKDIILFLVTTFGDGTASWKKELGFSMFVGEQTTDINAKICEGKYVKFIASARKAKSFWFGGSHRTALIVRDDGNAKDYEYANYINIASASSVFPVGTQIKVRGLKA